MEKIKIAQIGVTHEHAGGKYETLMRMSDVFELVGVYNDAEIATTPNFPGDITKTYHDVNWMSLDEILNYPGLQAVAVEVPNNELVPIALRCAEKGLAMHMDKPAGEEMAPFKQLLDVCKAKNLPFQMGYMFRGNPAFQFCIEAIRSKLIGDVVEIIADMNHCYGGEPYQDYISSFHGGIMFNLGCHLIDFVVAAMGRPTAVTPFIKPAPGYGPGYKNNCSAVLEYPGALVYLRSCSKDSTCRRAMKIAGTKGTLSFSPLERFDRVPMEIDLRLFDKSNGYPSGLHTLRFTMDADRYRPQLQELADVIHGKRESTYSYEHEHTVHEVVLAASGIYDL